MCLLGFDECEAHLSIMAQLFFMQQIHIEMLIFESVLSLAYLDAIV